MRIKQTRLTDAAATIAVLGTRDLVYRPAPAAVKDLRKWVNGVAVEFEIDDSTGQPTMVHLTPSPTPGGFRLKSYHGQRPWLYLPTSAIGVVRYRIRAQEVTETISENHISVTLPSAFQIEGPIAAAAE